MIVDRADAWPEPRSGGMEMEGTDPVCLEVIAVGPNFRELDLRRLGGDLKKPPFSRLAPLQNRLNC